MSGSLRGNRKILWFEWTNSRKLIVGACGGIAIALFVKFACKICYQLLSLIGKLNDQFITWVASFRLLEVYRKFDSLLRIKVHDNGAAKILKDFVRSTLPFVELICKNRLCGILYWLSMSGKTTQAVTDWAYELTRCIFNCSKKFVKGF